MIYHAALWNTIQHIAKAHNKSCSGLARWCKLDSTTFNHSKQFTTYGQPRWISTETLAKILSATQTTPTQFAQIFEQFLNQQIDSQQI